MSIRYPDASLEVTPPQIPNLWAWTSKSWSGLDLGNTSHAGLILQGGSFDSGSFLIKEIEI